MIPDVNPSLFAAAYVTGEVAEDFGANAQIKLIAQVAGGLLAAAVVYLAPTFPWLAQVGEAGVVAGLVAAGLVRGPALLAQAKALAASSPTPAPAPTIAPIGAPLAPTALMTEAVATDTPAV